MYYNKNIVLSVISLMFASCTSDNFTADTEKTNSPVIVEVMPASRSYITNKSLYHIKYKDTILDNVYLSKSEVALLKNAQSMEIKEIDVYGYSGWSIFDMGHKEHYTRNFTTNDVIAQQCGIAPGNYIATDVCLEQTYTFPNSMVIMLDNNDQYPSHTIKIGWDPNNLNSRGYHHSLSGSTLTLQTAAYKIDYIVNGQQTFRTYPVNCDSIVWKLKYIQVNP